MDFTRVLFVGLALILLCVGPAQGASSSSILISDSVVDTGTARRVELGLRVETSGGTGPRICADSTVTVIPQAGATGAFALVPNVVASPTVPYNNPPCDPISSAPCKQSFIIASTSTNPPTCTITGTFQIRFYACDNTGSASQALQTASITLNDRSVCSESLVSVATNISSFGAFADAGFSKTKSHYYINDMVYFPFHVTYEDLTISTLTFNTISVDSDTSSTVVLYSSSNTGVGNAVNLETSALTSQLETGTATMWFALQLNREEGSPFAHTPSSVTAYTFNVVFDVTYKHAKRGLHPSEGGQLYSKSTIMVHNKPVAQPRTPSSLELPANTGHILGSGILAVISSLAVLIFGF